METATWNSFISMMNLLRALGTHYIRCCTGETAEGVYHGRVTAYLEEQALP